MKKIAFLLTLFFIILFQISSAQRICYVDSSRTITTGSGTSWGDAYTTLSAALDEVDNNTGITEIRIAKGTYYPTNGTDHNVAFAILRGGLKIYGGYSPGGMYRNIAANTTILSGDIGTLNYINDNSLHVMVIAGLTFGADSVILDGLQISWGPMQQAVYRSQLMRLMYSRYG